MTTAKQKQKQDIQELGTGKEQIEYKKPVRYPDTESGRDCDEDYY